MTNTDHNPQLDHVPEKLYRDPALRHPVPSDEALLLIEDERWEHAGEEE